MPLLNNKRIELSKPPNFEEAKAKGKTEFWSIRFTNELFLNYEEYLKKLHIYRQPIWESEATGKGNLTYEEALDSEKNMTPKGGSINQSPFLTRAFLLQVLKPANLFSGNSDELLEVIMDKLKATYAHNEIVLVKFSGSIQTKCLIVKAVKPSGKNSPVPKKPRKDSQPAKTSKSFQNKASKRASMSPKPSLSNGMQPEASDNVEYIVRPYDDLIGKLGEAKAAHTSQITRSRDIYSKKSVKCITKLCSYRDRALGKIIVKDYLRDELKIKIPQNAKVKEKEDIDIQSLKDLIATADRNLSAILNSKFPKKKPSRQNTLLSSLISAPAAPAPKTEPSLPNINNNKMVPFIKINKPSSTTSKPKNNNLDLLKLMLSEIKKFPIDDLVLVQFQHLIEKKGLLYMLEEKWEKMKQKDKKDNTPTVTPSKKQLKLTSSGTLKLVELSSEEAENIKNSNPEPEKPEVNNGQEKQLQWPVPQSLWKVSPNLSEITMQTFVFLNWFVKPLQINGFTLDHYEAMLGHGLAVSGDTALAQTENAKLAVVPDCKLFISIITALLNLIIKDRLDDGPVADICNSRADWLEEAYADENEFFSSLVEEDDEQNKAEEPDQDAEEVSSKLSTQSDEVEVKENPSNIENDQNIDVGDTKPEDIKKVGVSKAQGSSSSSLDDLSDLSLNSDDLLSDTDYHSSDFETQQPRKIRRNEYNKKEALKFSSRTGLRNSKGASASCTSENGHESESDSVEVLYLESNQVVVGGSKIKIDGIASRKQKISFLAKLHKSWWKAKINQQAESWLYVLIGWLLESAIECPEHAELVKTIMKNDISPDHITQSVWKCFTIEQRLNLIDKLENDAVSCDSTRQYMELCFNESALLRKDLADTRKELKQIAEDKAALNKGQNPYEENVSQPSAHTTASSDKRQSLSENADSFFQKSKYSRTRATNTAFDAEREKLKLSKQEQVTQKRQALLQRDLEKCQIPTLTPIGQDRFGTKYYYIDGIGAGISNITSRLWVLPTKDYFANLKKAKVTNKSKGVEKSPLPDFVYKVAIVHMGPEIAYTVIGSGDKNINTTGNSFSKTSNTEGEGGFSEWLCYSSIAEIDSLMSWLDPRGINELQLLESLKGIYTRLATAMKKRARNWEKELEAFKTFSESLKAMANSPNSEHVLEETLENCSLRLSDSGNFCSWSAFSVFKDSGRFDQSLSTFVVEAPNYNNFEKGIHTAYGDIPASTILDDSDSQFGVIGNRRSVDFGVEGSGSAAATLGSKTDDSNSSDSSSSNRNEKRAPRLISLRTRNRYKSRMPAFSESYMQYR